MLRELRTGTIADAGVLAGRLDDLIAERTEPAPLWVRIGAASHAGMVRELDEDSLLTLDLRTVQNSNGRSWGLFIVADGMGGHAAGEVASGLAIRGATEVVLSAYLTPTLDANTPYDEAELKEIVRKAILQGNEYVIHEARARGNDMGTTITMALVAGDRAVIGNIGDSRTYIYREGKLRRISKDHSLVMRLVEHWADHRGGYLHPPAAQRGAALAGRQARARDRPVHRATAPRRRTVAMLRRPMGDDARPADGRDHRRATTTRRPPARADRRRKCGRRR